MGELNGDAKVIVEKIAGIDSKISDTNKMVQALHCRIDRLFEANALNDKNINGVEIKCESIQNELTEFKVDIATYKRDHADETDKKENKTIVLAGMFGGVIAWVVSFFRKG